MCRLFTVGGLELVLGQEWGSGAQGPILVSRTRLGTWEKEDFKGT